MSLEKTAYAGFRDNQRDGINLPESDSLGDEEDRQCRIILASCKISKRLLQAIDLRIANVCSIEEGEEVENTKLCC